MSRVVLLLILADVVVLAMAMVWIARRTSVRERDLQRRVAALESGRGMSTAAVLERTRAGIALVLEPAGHGTPEALVLASLQRVRPVTGADGAAAADIASAIQARRVIDAIKRYRQATGLGLKEAKDAIDHLRTQLGA